MSQQSGMTYAQSGVDYDVLDEFKRYCQTRAERTAKNAVRFGFELAPWTYGESVQLMQEFIGRRGLRSWGHVNEGLGTKNLVADAMGPLTGLTYEYYKAIGQDTVAMIVNDMITLGILPMCLAMHLAVGDSSWFNNEARSRGLVDGFGNSCDISGCVWGGGETPTLKDIILPTAAEISGSGFGVATTLELFNPSRIVPGDLIVILPSSGIHANGLTLARKIASQLPKGYETILPNGMFYGEALLAPTCIYCPFIELCINKGIRIHYGVNITGHGWRKFMRASQSFEYVIDVVPPPLPIFEFIQREAHLDDRGMYETFNMGAGFALFIDAADREKFCDVYRSCIDPNSNQPQSVVLAGYIEKSKEKKVVIRPKGLEYTADTLAVR